MKAIILCILTLIVCLCANAKVWKLSDKNLDIQFDDQTVLLKVIDKRCSKTWQQIPLKEKFTVKETNQEGNTLNVSLAGQISINVSISLNASSALEICLSTDKKISFNELAFPSAFMTPDNQHYILETDGEGLLLPADDTKYPLGNGITYSCGGGLAMAWMGVVDHDFQSGYMAILDTPFDVCLRTFRHEGLVTFSPVWLPSMGQFSYDRKVTYHFFDKGGYVAQCKKYRDYAWKKNHVITLKENQQKTPAMEKMIGAVHVYVWDNAREVSFAKELKASGIERAFILWNGNHVPYPEIDYDNRLKELGYATGGYELFTDLLLKDTVSYPVDLHGPYRFSRTTYPGLFKELVTRKMDGTTNYNIFGHTACPSVMQPHVRARVERELKEYPHESYFLDVYQANGLFECYAEKHPLSRQGYAEEVIKNQKMIANDYHQYLGGEWGADYCGSNAVYVHGMMTLQRTWWGSGIEKKGTIYYTGDWNSNPRPTQMLGTRVANDTYLKYSINEYTRVPLYELVYHDAIVTSWRWEDANHHTPEIWWKKDLFNILYGTAPLWNLDRNRWEEYKYTFIDSYKNICPWLQQIGYDEMVSHRFVTSDHSIQETVFSSGKRAVVNFGMSDVQFEGKTIKAKSFITMPN